MVSSFDDIYNMLRPMTLVFPRVMPIMVIVPAFSPTVVTGLVRNGFLAVMAMFIAPALDFHSLMTVPPLVWIAVVLKEALIGILLGFAFSTVMWAIAAAGTMIDFQTGSGNASFFDPMGGHEGGPTAGFLNLLAVTLFVTGGGLNLMLAALFESYRVWPVDSFAPHFGNALLPFAERGLAAVMLWTVKLAAPVVIVLAVVELGFGLIGRAMPQLNVFIMSQPVKSAVAVLMMALFLPFVYSSLHGFLGPDSGLVGLLKSML